MRTLSVAFLSALALSCLSAQPKSPTDYAVQGYIYKPVELQPSDDRIKQLQLPQGFRIEKWAEGLENPRIIAVAEDGTVYVTRRKTGDVVLLKNMNGKATPPQVVAQKENLHGIAIRGNQVYLAAIREVYVAERKPDGTLGPLKEIMRELPDAGQHPNRTLAVGPDGMLYVSVGSTCNSCIEKNPEIATMLRAKPDGTGREVFASGLRNTIGFAWHPETRQLYGWDHGIDWLGNDVSREEINLLEQGGKYGWPFLYEDNKKNPEDEPDTPKGKQFVAESRPSLLTHTAHSAGMQWVFYTGTQFPAEYRNDAFVTLRGSWNRKPPAGYEVVRVRFQNGKPVKIEPFLSGFLIKQGDQWANMGRLCGLAQLPDGSLLFGDDTGGVIYRVSYEGGERSRAR
jgi:glucose/arabinose dehydrogenase